MHLIWNLPELYEDRSPLNKPIPKELTGVPVVRDIRELEGVEVAILSTPTRLVEKYAPGNFSPLVLIR